MKVGSISHNVIVEKKKQVEWKTFSLDEYKQMFNQLVEGGHLTGNYEDMFWHVPDKLLDYPVMLSFDIEIYQSLNSALKGYTILRLLSGRSPLTIYNELSVIKKAAITAQAFQNLEAFKSYLGIQITNYSYQGHRTATDVTRFLSFYKMDTSEQIIEICSTIPNYKGAVRELPLFEDIMIFDDIVNDYFKTYSSTDTIKFLPIMLWWLLTNILPMRPSEFLLLKKDCLKCSSSSPSSCQISVPRIKNKSRAPGFVINYDLIKIDQNTYKFLYESIKKIDLLDIDSPFLFSNQLLTVFNKKNTSKKNRRMNRRDFDYLKDKFYKEIIEEIYGQYNLERIKSGDTRHFAIINMCLQGFNMLSIARMAGHDELKSQHSYFSHAEHFAQSYVYRLAQKKVENRISSDMGNGLIGWRRYIYDRGKFTTHNDTKKSVGKVQYGDCMEEKEVFPNTCIEDCIFCNNYRFNPSINESQTAIDWLTSTSDILELRIKESIELMKSSSNSLTAFLKNSNHDSLKSTSKNLLSYMDMKASVDAHLMEVKTFDQKNRC